MNVSSWNTVDVDSCCECEAIPGFVGFAVLRAYLCWNEVELMGVLYANRHIRRPVAELDIARCIVFEEAGEEDGGVK